MTDTASLEVQNLPAYEFGVDFVGGEYVVTCRGTPVLTPKGRHLGTFNGALASTMLAQFAAYPYWRMRQGAIVGPFPVSAYTLHSTVVDFFSGPDTNSVDAWQGAVLADPVLHPAAGPEQVDQYFAWEPVKELLRSHDIQGNHIWNFSEEDKTKLASFVAETWTRLAVPERAAATLLTASHGSLLAALSFLLRYTEKDGYALAVVGTLPVFGLLGLAPDDDHWKAYAQIRDAAATVREYLGVASHSGAELEGLVASGERERIEFKSTAFGRSGATPREKQSAFQKVLRTLAAFLNSDGGWLVLGVEDDGRIAGIPELVELSIDSFALRLADKLAAALSVDIARRIRLSVLPERNAAVLSCETLGRRVWLREGSREVLLVRQGPRTVVLEQREAKP